MSHSRALVPFDDEFFDAADRRDFRLEKMTVVADALPQITPILFHKFQSSVCNKTEQYNI